eukprot:TRINITY_DN66499_c10_g2_i1.p1 TRINITY_DN66499_c10_g2~~TRINITY_DN66499_c10_g2_i1.p1  ORF type:complete len:309 (-),score=-17.10 TRINITY_DN66499_c10_g2_i1:62-988(-)
MKRNKLILMALSLFLLGWSNMAVSQIRTPLPSPNATVSQQIGVTNVKIEYSSPGVKGRTVWGGLEKYDVAWRAGANQATKITFEDDVQINGTTVKKGSYNIFITPKKEGDWLVHINTGGNVFSYNGNQDSLKSMDAVTVSVKPKWVNDVQERLKYNIDYVSDNEGTISMSWEKAVVSFNVSSETKKLTATSIERQIGNWYAFANSAIYYADNDLDLAKAAAWVDMSLSLNDKHFYPKWAKAVVAAKGGDFSTAAEYAAKAKEIGDSFGGKSGFYNANQKNVEDSLAKWKEKAGTSAKKGKKKKGKKSK